MSGEGVEAWQTIGVGRGQGGILIVADHASARIPDDIDLGIPADVLTRHVAVDIGVAPLAQALCDRLDCDAVLGGVSRLVCDCNREEDAAGLMEALDELASRWRQRIDWGIDDDAQEAPDTSALLQAAFVQLREQHYSLWTMETGEATLAGWITHERDEEAMQLVAGALGLSARPGVG